MVYGYSANINKKNRYFCRKFESLLTVIEPYSFKQLLYTDSLCSLQWNVPVNTGWVADSAAVDTMRIHIASDIFGTSSHLGTQSYDAERSLPFTLPEDNSWQMAGAILLLICMFCFSLHRYGRQLGLLLKNTSSIQGTLNMFDNPSRDFAGFMVVSRLMALASISITITSILITYQPHIATFYYISLGVIGITIWSAFQCSAIINRICGYMSDQQPLFAQARTIGNFDITFFAIIYPPIATVTTLSNAITIWAILAVSAAVLFHIIRIFTYLYRQKFSFLQWFLYLCAVEILPLSMFIGLIFVLSNVAITE